MFTDTFPTRHLLTTGIAVAVLSIVAIALLGGSAAAAPITSCGEINQSGTQTVQNDLLIDGDDCFTVTADDVTLDLNGHSIDGNDSGFYYGVYVQGADLTVENGTIQGFARGIDQDRDNLTVDSVDITSNTVGIYTSNVDGLSVASTHFGNNDNYAVDVYNGSAIHILNSSFYSNADTGNSDATVFIRQSSDISIDETTMTQPIRFGAIVGEPGRGVWIRDSTSVQVTDLSVTRKFVGIDLDSVEDVTVDTIEMVEMQTEDYRSTNVSNVNVDAFQIGEDERLSFEHQLSNTSLTGWEVNANVPDGYTANLDRLDIEGLYPGQTVSLDYQSSPLMYGHPATLGVHRNSSTGWDQFPHTNDWTAGESGANISSTLDQNGEYDIFETHEVSAVTVANKTVPVGGDEALTVEAEYIDGTVVPVTTDTNLFSAEPAIASIDGATVTGESPGTATIAAYYTDPHSSQEWNGTGQVEVIDGPDPVPESYYGTLEINGDPAPTGTIVEARINGSPVGHVTVDTTGQYGGPGPFDQTLTVSGSSDDVSSNVTFHVLPPGTDLIPGTADETATFQPDTLTEQNLSATLETTEPPIYETTIPNDGTPTAVGLPAPTNGTLGEMFGDLSGINNFYVHTADGWEQVWQPDHEFEALEAFVITTSGQGPATINVTVSLESNSTATDRTLPDGWSLVPAPAWTDAEDAFGQPENLVVLDSFNRPSSGVVGTGDAFDSYVVGSTDWGASAPTVSPFGAYFVYSDSSTTLPLTASAFPYRQALDIQLGLRADDGVDRDGDGYSMLAGDCDDFDASRHPGATEVADGVDTDCNGLVDDVDSDGDGFTTAEGDCDDSDPTRYPGADEVADGVDNDCDGMVDENVDADGDGYSVADGDCDDSDTDVYPGATELADGKDNDCDGEIDEGIDADGDGWTVPEGDCDDNDPNRHPNATEVADGIDNDCDGQIDEGV